MIAFSSIVARSYSVMHPRSYSQWVALVMVITKSWDDAGGTCDESAGEESCTACGDDVGETATSTPLVLPPVGNLERPCSALGSFL